MPDTTVFVFASGTAKRYPAAEGNPEFKQLLECPIEKRPIICRTVERFAQNYDVVVVTPHAPIIEALRQLPKEVKRKRMTILGVGTPPLMTETLRLTRPAWRKKNLGVLADVWFSERAFRSMEESMELADGPTFWGRRERSFITGNVGEVFSWMWREEDNDRLGEAIDAAAAQWEELGWGSRDAVGTPLGCPWQLYRHLNGIPLDFHTTDPGGWIDINDFTDDFDTPQQYVQWKGRFSRRLILEPPFKSIGNFDDWRPCAQLKPLDIIVLSTGHSATGYVAKLLTSAGIPCGHEGIFRNIVLESPRFRADSSFFAVAHLDDPIAKGARLVHLVRHPLKVIRSWHYAGTSPENDRWSGKVLEAAGMLDFDIRAHDLENLGRRWVRWNQLIEKKAPGAVLVRAEDGAEILGKLGHPFPPDADNLFSDRQYNSKLKAKEAPEVSYADLGAAADDVRDMARRYGYG